MKTVIHILAGLTALLGGTLLIPMGVALLYGEWYTVMGLGLSAVGMIVPGAWVYRITHQPQGLGKIQALQTVAMAWLLMAILGGLPLLLTAYLTPPDVAQSMVPSGVDFGSSLDYFKNPLHALFESMSAYTTTGLTMAVHEPTLGKGLLFYRSFAQWIGGGGVIMLSLAVLSQIQARDRKLLFGAETAGILVRHNIIATARVIWKAYFAVTAFSFVYLVIGTWMILPDYGWEPTLFDSLNHAMCGQSTGGFSTLDDSIAGYQSGAMEALYLLPMILGALSLPFFYKLIHLKQASLFWKDPQTRGLLLAFVMGSAALAGALSLAGTVDKPIRTGIFQYISAISTTGWQTSDPAKWGEGSVLLIIATAMVIGGAAGGTVGGIKFFRFQAILSSIRNRVLRMSASDHQVLTPSLEGTKMSQGEFDRQIADILTFVAVFIGLAVLGGFTTYLLQPDNFRFLDAWFESLSAQATVGLSAGITGPEMPIALEIQYILQMWIGRLEIFPVLFLLGRFITKRKN